jgi:hypothetical protein
MYQHLPLQGSPKFTQIGIFGSLPANLAPLRIRARSRVADLIRDTARE